VIDKEKIKGKAEQTVGILTGSEEAKARGEVDESKGKVQETIAGVKVGVKKVTDQAVK
jgi:uncharacterized protein YjbJ (UPF0337 family)